jgi:hypothetical protein
VLLLLVVFGVGAAEGVFLKAFVEVDTGIEEEEAVRERRL